MKTAFIFLLTSFSAFAGNVTTITCPVKESFQKTTKEITVEFRVKNLGNKNANLLQHPKANQDMGMILVSPEMVEDLYSQMTHLNGQGGDLRVQEDRIRLFGDGDGYTFVDLVLFKNTEYQKGYVRVYGSGVQMYQKINCTLK